MTPQPKGDPVEPNALHREDAKSAKKALEFLCALGVFAVKLSTLGRRKKFVQETQFHGFFFTENACRWQTHFSEVQIP